MNYTIINKDKYTAIYVRVSTKKSSQKDSPEHQEGVCREKARQLEFEVDHNHIYEDRDSGTNIVGRPAIQQLIKDAQRRLFNNVIFASLSRFSRDTMDSLTLKRILVDSLGMRLISLDEGYDSYIDKDELKFQIISAVNQKMSEQTSLSSKRGIRQSALKGNFIGSIPPFGYKKTIVNGRKTLIPDEQTKDIILLIFTLYTAHKMGEKQIVNYLNNEKKIPSPKGGNWGITSIQRILQNEAYTGVNVFGKYETRVKYNNIEDLSDRKKVLVQKNPSTWERPNLALTHETLIDKKLFDLAQEIRLQRGGGKRGGVRNRKNIFAGIIKCEHCNSAMVSMKTKSKNTNKFGLEYRYLICSRRRRQGNAGCSNNYWLPYHSFKDDAIECLTKEITKLSVDDLFNKHIGSIQNKNVESEGQQKAIQKQIESNRKMLFELRKEKMSTGMDDGQYQFEKQQYEQELMRLNSQIDEININVEHKKDLRNLYDEVKDALDDLINLNYEDEDDFEELRLILLKLIKRITVDEKGNVKMITTFGLTI
ncbi:hypothetical protein PAECIP111892_03611 [Paenibacillus auburnensis]|uniref:Recombinase family protein n=1 Tax=Paenibacillus auburnensis TaxID=2905649 RepID=A0ABN8GTT9_9BACL|nr:recombinase family protein [Paenibacillus auburnensis]CAH1211630.1 hypothetical protein PAECIP111892_03611 [Paenibacillus auburnensis]